MAITDLSQPDAATPGIGIGDVVAMDKVEYITLSLTDITNGYTTFAAVPGAGGKVKVTIISGTAQHAGVDFIVDSGLRRITWTGLGLDGFLSAGDVLLVNYMANA